MNKGDFELVSPLSPAQCAARLSANISFYPLNNPFFLRGCSKPVVGDATSTNIYLRRRIAGRNSFQTILFATIHSTERGTVIRGRFGLHPLTRKVTKVWGCSAVFIGVPVLLYLVGGLLSGTTKVSDLWDVSYRSEMVALLFFVWVGVVYGMGRGVAKGEDGFLKQFLIQTLQAHEVTP